MVRFAKPHVSVISTDLGRNIMVLISLDFTKGNLIVRFGIPLISVIFKNSAAVTNTRPGPFFVAPMIIRKYRMLFMKQKHLKQIFFQLLLYHIVFSFNIFLLPVHI